MTITATRPDDARPVPDRHLQNVYRPDIDGLRAIAVLSVVLFHLDISWVPGGFAGVDVFFVISGYLIGGQIFRQAATGSFTYAEFYARRVRRILPALYALIVFLYAAGIVLLTPLELRELGREAAATVAAASNFLFYTGGGYFAAGTAFNPLLMTWTLGVEEQFYIVFPVIVFLILRLKARPFAFLSALSAASFLGSLLLMKLDQQAAFYLLPTRAWELGIGALLALWEQQHRKSDPSGPMAEGLAILSLLVLCGSILFYRAAIPFPGLYVALPTAATAILIWSGRAWTNRVLLSNTVAAFIGKISYSVYLWHWPLVYLNRILFREGRELSAPVLLALTLVLSVLSWRFVEQPFRRRVLPTRIALWIYAAIGAALIGLAVFFYVSNGWPSRLSPQVQAFARSTIESRESPCLAPYGATQPRLDSACLPQTGGGRLLVLGDSHASAIAPGFRDMAQRMGLGFGEITKSSCPPLWQLTYRIEARPRHFGECIAFQRNAFDYVAAHPEVKIVVLAGYWATDLSVAGPGAPSGGLALDAALDRSLARLAAPGRRILLVQDVPTFRFDPYRRVIGDLIAARRALTGVADGVMAAPHAEVIADPSRALLQSVARRHPGVQLIDPMTQLCGNPGCQYRGPDSLYYSDFQHVTPEGARAALRTVHISAP